MSAIGGKEFKDRQSRFDLWVPFHFLKKLLESDIPSVFLEASQQTHIPRLVPQSIDCTPNRSQVQTVATRRDRMKESSEESRQKHHHHRKSTHAN